MELNELITVAVLWGVAAITPGPNFFITVHTTVESTSRLSLFTVLGIVIGTLVWSLSGFLGISILFKTVPFIYYSLKILGGLYLMYVGLNLIFKRKINHKENRVNRRRAIECFRLGLLTNLLNPKTAIFMASLFAAIIPPSANLADGTLCVLIICSISAVWYTFVVALFSNDLARNIYEKQKAVIEKIAGTIFVGFGIKLVSSK